MTHVLCAVEVGWRGMRECSLALARQGASILVLIKGAVPADVLAMISPTPGVTLADAPSRTFWWRLTQRLWTTPRGGAERRLLIVNKPKTLRWTASVGAWRGWQVVRLEETAQGFRLLDHHDRDVTVQMLGASGAFTPRHVTPPEAPAPVAPPPMDEGAEP